MGSWMGLSGSVVGVVVVVIAAMVQCSAAQTTYVVGNSTGWGIPQSNSQFYATWASNKTFAVGDILSFIFSSQHDVANVPEADYTSCNTSTAGTIYTVSPHNFTLTAGPHYYICTIGDHCSRGQKLFVNVTASGTPTPPTPGGTTTSPPPPPPSSPSNSSAPSRAAGFGVAGVSVIAVFTALFL